MADYLARKGMPVSRSTRHGGPCGNALAIDRGVELNDLLAERSQAFSA